MWPSFGGRFGGAINPLPFVAPGLCTPHPAHHRFRTHNDRTLLPTRPGSPEENPKQLVHRREPWSNLISFENYDPAPQDEVFKKQQRTIVETATNRARKDSIPGTHFREFLCFSMPLVTLIRFCEAII